MNISIFNDYAIFDAGKQKNIDSILVQLEKVTANEVVLDFTNCLIDYPATSKLIDRVLVDLSQVTSHKKLTIKSDLTVNNESLLLSLLVWGSTFFDFSNIKRTSPAEDYRAVMIPELQKHRIAIEVNLLKDDNSLFKAFSYA